MTDVATTTILCTSVAGLIVSVMQAVLQYKREARAHQWALDTAKDEKIERERVAAELKAHTEQTAAMTTADRIRRFTEVATKIDENTAVNEAALHEGKRAYTEANNLSLKIAQVGLRLAEDAPRRRQADEASLNVLKTLSEDTNTVVHDTVDIVTATAEKVSKL